jgi:hypothetical protein
MKTHPIIMDGESVRAIRERRKTQTRRVVDFDVPSAFCATDCKGQLLKEVWWDPGVGDGEYLHVPCKDGATQRLYCRDAPGDRLWVRETWAEKAWTEAECARAGCPDARTDPTETYLGRPVKAIYRASYNTALGDSGPWRSPVHMPRWASRLELEVLAVRAERLQEISEMDVEAEGYGVAFAECWDALNAKRGHGWQTNPYVWAIEFKVVT